MAAPAFLDHSVNSDDDLSAMADSATDRTPLLDDEHSTSAMGPGQKWQYLAAVAACLSAMSVGTTMSWTSAAGPTLKLPKNESDIVKDKFYVDEVEFSWVSALLSIGAMIGAVPLGMLANTIGRKKVLLFLAPVMVLGFVILAFANTLWMLYLGRFLNGVVTGAYCVVTTMYTGEIAEDSIRGTLGSFFQLLITVGIFFNYVLDALDVSLFVLNLICACIPVVLFLSLMRFPDTPRWNLSKNNRAEAERSLQFFRGVPNVEKELNSIQEDIDTQKAKKQPFSQAIGSTAAKKGLTLALAAMFFQQLSGINAVIFYSREIFEAANSGLDAKLSTVIVGVFQVAFTYIATLLVDRLGRKPLLIFSGAVMALSGAVLGLYFFLAHQDKSSVTSLGWLPIVCMIVFIVVFSLGFGPIPWLYMSEVFSDQMKEPGMALATVVNWLSVFIVTKFYSDLSNSVGNYATFWIFSAISVLGCIFNFFFMLETKGKTNAEILAELEGRPISEQNTQSIEQGNGNDRF